MKRVPLARPWITKSDVEAVSGVVRSGNLSTGVMCDLLEASLVEYTSGGGAVALSSGTTALELCFDAMVRLGQLDRRKPLAIPDLTCVAVPAAALRAGLSVWLMPTNGPWISGLAAHDALVAEKICGVVMVHYGGWAPDNYTALADACMSANVPMIEDCAHAIGAKHDGQRIGSARVNSGPKVFSFHPTKMVATGEGGAIVSDDEELIALIRKLAWHGKSSHLWDAMFEDLGTRGNLSDVHAALAENQLSRIDVAIDARGKAWQFYRDLLEGVSGVLPLEEPTCCDPSYCLAPVCLTGKTWAEKFEVVKRLRKRGVEAWLHWPAAHTLPPLRHHENVMFVDLPEKDTYAAEVVTLPMWPGIDLNSMRYVVSCLKEVLAE